MTGFMNGFGDMQLKRVGNDMCKIAMNGRIAVKTSNGYKTYDPDSGRLTNCSNLVTDMGMDAFFVIPATKVRKEDIILVNGTPRCVINVQKGIVTVLNYENNAIEQIVPERHMFMGNIYFYSKIYAPILGVLTKGKSKKNANKMMRLMMMQSMMGDMMGGRTGGGFNTGDGGNMGNFMQMMMMSNMMKEFGGSDGLFGMFDDMDEDDDGDVFPLITDNDDDNEEGADE